MALGDQIIDHGDHAVDMLGRARLMGRRQAPESGDILVVLLIGALGDLTDRVVQREFAGGNLVTKITQSARIDLVVHVGDVADIGDMVFTIEMTQQTEQHVEHDGRPRIADMGIVIDRRSADIHADIVRIVGSKNLLLPGQCIVDPEGRCGRVGHCHVFSLCRFRINGYGAKAHGSIHKPEPIDTL